MLETHMFNVKPTVPMTSHHSERSAIWLTTSKAVATPPDPTLSRAVTVPHILWLNTLKDNECALLGQLRIMLLLRVPINTSPIMESRSPSAKSTLQLIPLNRNSMLTLLSLSVMEYTLHKPSTSRDSRTARDSVRTPEMHFAVDASTFLLTSQLECTPSNGTGSSILPMILIERVSRLRSLLEMDNLLLHTPHLSLLLPLDQDLACLNILNAQPEDQLAAPLMSAMRLIPIIHNAEMFNQLLHLLPFLLPLLLHPTLSL